MPESDRPEHRTDRSPSSAEQYTIRRKGSRYNIIGPGGRVFTRYKSASVAGPRWEELTHTPWPYRSSAYAPGTRLWELGLIKREQVGQRTLSPTPETPAPTAPTPTVEPPPDPPRPDQSQPEPPPAPPKRKNPVAAQPIPLRLPDAWPPALPAPRIDLVAQARRIEALRHDPNLLFDPPTRQALQIEVDYHRPQAKWAQTLLKLLDRYEKRQRAHQPATTTSSATILAKHIAWQEQQSARAQA